MPTEDLLTTREALALLHISRTHLYNLMRRGRITPIRYSTEAKTRVPLYFPRRDVERLAQPVARAG